MWCSKFAFLLYDEISPFATCTITADDCQMSKSIVDYENLIDTSFTDSNMSIRTSVRPRWERKKTQQQLSTTESDRPPLSTCGNGDRFIPNRAGMNIELSKHLMRPLVVETTVENGVNDDQKSVSNAKKTRYTSNLSSALLGVDDIKGNRVISYQDKAPAPKGDTVNNLNILYSAADCQVKRKTSTKLVTRQIPSAPS